MIEKKILNLFNVNSYKELNKGDKQLYNDILNLKIKQGGGFSIRPDLGNINGMTIYTGYLDKSQPLFIGELLENVSNQI
jgi:hypothetical protein